MRVLVLIDTAGLRLGFSFTEENLEREHTPDSRFTGNVRGDALSWNDCADSSKSEFP